MSGYNVSIPESEPPLYQLQDNGYTVIWAPILFATVIALSLVGILVPLWEFLFQRVSWGMEGVRICRYCCHVARTCRAPGSLSRLYGEKECFPLNF